MDFNKKIYPTRDWLYQKYWINGLSLSKIAKIYKVSIGTIWRLMKKFNIKIRSLSESNSGDKNPMYGKRGKRHWNWKGGKRIDSRGYCLVYRSNHPHSNCDGYIAEHRLIMENILGRYLKSNELVHHKNETRDDNRPSNLSLFTKGRHLNFHKELKKNRILIQEIMK